ncbi:probable cytochrome P450 313a4 [Lucilia sericata]|uniref:probable cytochrome P450 313a4 n=1 Tax=Lucilia sericata TaxID=13632 RepID=UPI0018A84640|nr:probable cytochrome P450 313a4 [Lucilia sericata]
MFSSLKDFDKNVCSVNCVITVLCLLLVYSAKKKFSEYRSMRQHGLPIVYGLPFLGILYQFVPIQKFLYVLGSYFDKLKSWSYLTWFANVPLIITTDTDIIKHILNSDVFLNKSGVIYDTMNEAMPDGIITSKYFKWKHNRKLMNPSFAPQIIQQFIPSFNKYSKRISKYFESLRVGEEHAIFGHIKQEILEMAVGNTMGSVLAEGENVNGNMANNFNKLLGKMVVGTTLSFVKLSFLIRTSTYYQIIDNLKGYMKNLIKRKMGSTIKNEDKYFLDRAIKYQQQKIFAIDDVITETYTMIIGSFETVSTTLYSIIIMLAMHKDVQQKLYQEVFEIMADSKNIDYKDLDQMAYLNMVIDETLRLMPPIPLIGRESLESCHLTDAIKLPKGFQILISIFHLHRRQDLWGAKADLFNPDNFLPENIEKRHPYAYIPFSKGVRNCIGWRYALIALKVLVLNLVRDFEFSTDFPYDELIFINQVSLRFLNEPKIQFIKRNVSAE